jgi:hypothetical protein
MQPEYQAGSSLTVTGQQQWETVSQGAAIRKQHHPAPLLFDASHPAIEDAEVVFQEKSSTKDCFSGAGI